MNAEIAASRLAKEASKKLSPATYIAAQLRTLDRDTVEQYALAFVMLQVKQRNRATVRTVERESARPVSSRSNGWVRYEDGEVARDPEWALVDENNRRRNDLDSIFRKHIERSYLELEDKLLRSKFARGDGTQVTWGEATYEDHMNRYEMHRSNVEAGIEGGARHLQAAEMLKARNAANLNEIAKEKAA